MLNLCDLARIARRRAQRKMDALPPDELSNTKAFVALNQPFHERVMDACRKHGDNPHSADEALFIALPERFLGKCAYLCLDRGRKPDGQDLDDPDASIVSALQNYTSEQRDCQFINFEKPLTSIKDVLFCHGLSPVADSLLLLADMGRGFRVSWALDLGLRVMLADISWMTSNRSIRQITSLDQKEVDTGLRVCLDKRKRLYEALSIDSHVHKILPYERQKAISEKKLDLIGSRYLELAWALWGTSGDARLEAEIVKRIDRPLYSLSPKAEADLPKHIAVLSQYPGVLAALEKELTPHLEILRVIAKQFNSFDKEVFIYFFAQYYAQDSYRGSVLKVAPISERAFDSNFDRLDPYFRAWGDGHSTSDILAANLQKRDVQPMTVAYLPQYSISGTRALPYTPLSLDVMKNGTKDHSVLRDRLIMLDDESATTKDRIYGLVRGTPIYARNRLLADIISFLMMSSRRVSSDQLASCCRNLGLGSLSELLHRLGDGLAEAFFREAAIEKGEDLRLLWGNWLKTIEASPKAVYTPSHVYVNLLEEADWTPARIEACVDIFALAASIYKDVT